MAALEDLKTLFTEYIATAEQVRQKAPAFAGIFGLGNDPRNDRCHDIFFEATEQWAAAFAASSPSAAYWYLYAGHGVTRPLIPMLPEETCLTLRDFYNEAYPATDRPPVQREVYKLLQQYAGQKVSSGSFLQRLFGKK